MKKQNKLLLTIQIVLSWLCVVVMLGGCCLIIINYVGCFDKFKGYSGGSPELYTMAIDVFPEDRGYLMIGGEVFAQPVVQVIDTDEYNRKLFCYFIESQEIHERNSQGDVILLICQYSNELETYYYPDHNFLSANLSDDTNRLIYGFEKSKTESVIVDPLKDFAEEELNSFKEKNDWNRSLNFEKCIKTKIVRLRS